MSLAKPQRGAKSLSKQSLDPNQLRAPTVSATGQRRWLYPERLSGRHANRRRNLAVVLILIYLALPFISIGNQPLLRLDLQQGVAFVFGLSFHFNETSYMAILALLAIFSLCLITLLFGRVWCGYGCPQTVFVEWVYRPIEEWIEGPANHRRAINQKKLTPESLRRKIAKHACFLLVSVVLGNIFLGYFVSPQNIWSWMQSNPIEHPTAFLVMLAVTLLTYFDFAWFREQFCSFLCPYARLQAVFIAPETPTVAYDASRGEPRGKRSKTGDCIDCGLCVRVCPTGIDIRNGLQLECIQCSRCVDACDLVMSNLKRPTGLIRHASQAALQQKDTSNKTRLRPIIYATAIVLLLSLLSMRLHNRTELSIATQRIPETVTLPGGQVGNIFHLRVQSNSNKPTMLSLSAVDQETLFTISCSVCDKEIPPLGSTTGTLMISSPKTALPQDIQILIRPGENILRLKLLP